MRPESVALGVALALFASPALAGPSLAMLICQPGGPDLHEEQLVVIEKMYRYLETKLELPEGAVTGTYLNERAKCVKALEASPSVVFPSLPFYLEHRASLGLVPVAQLSVSGRAEDHYYVLVKKGSALKLADLAGKRLVGTHTGSRRFVTDVVFAGRLPGAELVLVEEKLGLRAIRAVTRGAADAVLLDGTQYRALKGTRFEGELHMIYSSPAVPTPPIAVIPKRMSQPGLADALGRALIGMTADRAGQEVVRLFAIEGFLPPDVRALDALAIPRTP